MTNFIKFRILTGLILLAVVSFYGFSDKNKDTARIHALKLKSPKDTKALLHYTGDPLTLVSAHRGGSHTGFPENCLQTFENTLTHTYAIMECDPRYTKDSAIVLHHDPSLRRTTNGQGSVIDFTLEELKKLKLKDREGNLTEYQIPTLDEALEWAKGRTILVLDQKDVPVSARVKKVQEHKAEANVIMIVYSFEEAVFCYKLNNNIVMEVMIPNIEKVKEFEKTGVPWENVIAFVGHNLPQDKELYDLLHQKGVMCMAGSSRNVDRKYLTKTVTDFSTLKNEYLDFFVKGIDLIETDIPRELGTLLYKEPPASSKKSKYFR